MSRGPLIELGPVTVSWVEELPHPLSGEDPYAWRERVQIRVRAAVRVLPDGLLPLLTLPVHDEPSDKDVTVRPVTRREEG